ncbi:hypothetical protein SK128_000563 [Halocaridina rubra]|uniref:Uncharacterized protein n=1 Tax=Halocaridina rubra TaxID=373956 RepID=A0AAN8WWU4_HALRR
MKQTQKSAFELKMSAMSSCHLQSSVPPPRRLERGLTVYKEFDAGNWHCCFRSTRFCAQQANHSLTMKVVFLLSLVALAAAMPAPEADPMPAPEAEADPQVLLTHPLTYTYPIYRPVEVKTKTLPLVYSYTNPLPLNYYYSFSPYSYFPYNYPLLVKPAEEAAAAEEPAVQEA